MSFNIIFGILLIATGAFSAGSFAVPFGKIKVWQWETYWMVYSLIHDWNKWFDLIFKRNCYE